MHETEGYDTPARLPFWLRWIIMMLICIAGAAALAGLVFAIGWLLAYYPIHLAVAFGVLVFLGATASLANEWW